MELLHQFGLSKPGENVSPLKQAAVLCQTLKWGLVSPPLELVSFYWLQTTSALGEAYEIQMQWDRIRKAPFFQVSGRTDCLNCNRRLEFHGLRNPHIKWTILVLKKWAMCLGPGPVYFLWLAPFGVLSTFSTQSGNCTGNDTPGWGSIHIATIGIPFSHSQSTGCPTPVASRYTTLIFSVPLRTNLSLRQTYRLRKCHKHFHISYK